MMTEWRYQCKHGGHRRFERLKPFHFFSIISNVNRYQPSSNILNLMGRVNRYSDYLHRQSKVDQGTNYVTKLGRSWLQLIMEWHVH